MVYYKECGEGKLAKGLKVITDCVLASPSFVHTVSLQFLTLVRLWPLWDLLLFDLFSVTKVLHYLCVENTGDSGTQESPLSLPLILIKINLHPSLYSCIHWMNQGRPILIFLLFIMLVCSKEEFLMIFPKWVYICVIILNFRLYKYVKKYQKLFYFQKGIKSIMPAEILI